MAGRNDNSLKQSNEKRGAESQRTEGHANNDASDQHQPPPAGLNEQDKPPSPSWPPFAGALAKSLASPAFISSLFKGLLKGYFKSPARLFRPSRAPVSPGQIVWERVKSSIGRSRLGKNKTTSQSNGNGKNGGHQSSNGVHASTDTSTLASQPQHPLSLVIPLVFFNSASGLLLFQSFQQSSHLLSLSSLNSHPSLVALLAGAIGGATQALVSTPLENFYRILPPGSDPRLLRIRIKEASKQFTGPRVYRRLRWAYKGLVFTSLKDAFGFALFFGTYATVKKMRPISRFFSSSSSSALDSLSTSPSSESDSLPNSSASPHLQPHQPSSPSLSTSEQIKLNPKTLDVLLAGSLAGAIFQLATAPLDRLRTVLSNGGNRVVWDALTGELESTGPSTRPKTNTSWQSRRQNLFSSIRQLGFQYFFNGLAGQIGRAVVPSAVALGVYEWAKVQDRELAGDDDDDDDEEEGEIGGEGVGGGE